MDWTMYGWKLDQDKLGESGLENTKNQDGRKRRKEGKAGCFVCWGPAIISISQINFGWARTGESSPSIYLPIDYLLSIYYLLGSSLVI